MAGAVVVGGVHPHTGAGHAVFAEGDSRRDALFLERAVVLVQIQLVRLRVVGQQNVGPAVIVVVENSNTEAFGSRVIELGLLRGVLKLSVAQVVPESRRRSLVGFRRAIRLAGAVQRAEEVARNRPLHIVRHHQIEFAIAVIVHPGGAGGKFVRAPQAGGLGHIVEGSVAVVVKQMALPQRGDEKILKAIVVVIAHGHSQTEHGNRQAGFASDVGEASVVVVVIQLERGGCTRMAGPVFAIDQHDVGPSVVVVVNEGAARAHGFGKIFFSKSAVVMDEADAGLGDDVAELDGLRAGGGDHPREQQSQDELAHYLEAPAEEATL